MLNHHVLVQREERGMDLSLAVEVKADGAARGTRGNLERRGRFGKQWLRAFCRYIRANTTTSDHGIVTAQVRGYLR